MKTETKKNLSLLPLEVKKQITLGNYEIVFNTEIDIKKRLFIFLSMLGLPSHLAGYDYIKDALLLCIDNSYKLPEVSKIVYPEIAKKYKKSPSQVERCIRHAISKSIDRGNGDILFFIFGYTLNPQTGTPTNSEYLSQIVKFLESMCN